MNLLLYIIPILILIFTFYKVYKSQKKYLLELQLLSQYDKIELHILKTRRHLSNSDIKFLQTNKNICVNPQYLDIEFIIALNHIIKTKNIKIDTEWYKVYVTSQDEILQNLLAEYSDIQVEYSLLTALKISYILKAFWLKVYNFITNKTLDLKGLFKSKIESALYNGNNLSQLANC